LFNPGVKGARAGYGMPGVIIIVMYKPLILGLSALLAQGCASRPAITPQPASLESFFRIDYRTWTCQQLSEEADLLSDALPVALEHEPNAQTTERVAHIKRAKEAVREQLTLKKCKRL
jgi:hypothetical protein